MKSSSSLLSVLAPLLTLLLCASSGCRSRVVATHEAKEAHQRIVERTRVDSLYFVDTILIAQRGDTIYRDRIKYRERVSLKRDTLVARDTIYLRESDLVTASRRGGVMPALLGGRWRLWVYRLLVLGFLLAIWIGWRRR